MLKGRLGLETARIPQADRHGVLWLARGKLFVAHGTLRFITAGDDTLSSGDYSIPFQMLSCVLLGPGSTVSHDALRLLARHGTGLIATGEDGVRFYASMPFGKDDSALARRQVLAWANPETRVEIARKMYAWRLGEVLPNAEIHVLRGIEGARMKETYRRLSEQFGVSWKGRRYDRSNPEDNDDANQAINHAASAVEAAAMVSVAVVSAVPSLGFIHEDSSLSFCLDIADLYRDSITLPVAFGAVRESAKFPTIPLERMTRKLAGKTFKDKKLIPQMIDRIKELFAKGAGKT